MARKELPLDILKKVGTGDEKQKGESVKRLVAAHNEEFRLCGLEFWYWMRFVETDDEDEGLIHPFPVHYDYLRRVDYEIESVQSTIILKSRRLLLSWLGMMRQLHGGMFANTGIPGTYDAYLGGVMSIGETEATYLIKRATKVYHRLPEWMKERNRLLTDNKLLMEFEKGGTIQAFPMKKEGPQTFGFSRVFFDEMALQEAARSTWMGMIPTLGAKGKLLAVSTPNGKSNLFYDIWINKNDQFSEIKRISIQWTGEVRVHHGGDKYDAYPVQVDQQPHDEGWRKRLAGKMDRSGIARNLELSFASPAGDPVWPTFDHDTHVRSDIVVNKKLPMFIGWDFGFHFPAVVFFQYNSKDQYIGIREYVAYDISFDQFCKDVIIFANTFYDRKSMSEIHFVDPAGFQRYHTRAQSGAMSDVAEMRVWFGRDAQIRAGSQQVGTRANEGPRLKEVRKLFALRADGEPGILYSEKMVLLIEGCGGAYHYPEKGGEEPAKDEASHTQDAKQYVVTGHGKLTNVNTRQRKTEKYDGWVGGRTGM